MNAIIALFSRNYVVFLTKDREATARLFLKRDSRFRGGQIESHMLPRDVSIGTVYRHQSPEEAGLMAANKVV